MFGACIDPQSPIPRYYQIYSALRERIVRAELRPGQPLPSERQIAESYGVARLTVVRALELLAREGFIERQHGRGTFVLEPADEAKPRMMAFVSSPTLSSDLVIGISQTAFAHRYQVQMLGVDFAFKHLEASLASGVQGFLVYGRPGTGDVATYEKLWAQGVPVVMVDRYYPGLGCDYVVYDNEEAGYRLTRLLLSHGHRRVAILPGLEVATTAVRDRLRGYRKALEEAGLPYDEDLVWLDIYNASQPSGLEDERFQAILQARLGALRPSALVTINDDIAESLIHDLLLLHRSLLRVSNPEVGLSYLDLELATFTDRPRNDPSYLSAVAIHPTERLGQIAAKLLIDRLDGVVAGAAKRLVIPMDIVELPAGIRQIARRGEP